MNKILLSTLLFVSVISNLRAQIYTPTSTIQGTSWNNYIGIGTATPSALLNIEGSHGDSRFLIHANGNGNPDTYQADLTLWASEPGLTWSGVGIGNNIHNFKTATGGLTLLNTARGGSYIRLLENGMLFNVVSVSGADKQVLSIDANGYVGIGTTSADEKLTVDGNEHILGNLFIGKDTETAMISGPTNCGAIQIKSHSGLGGVQNRYLRLGWKDNNSSFQPVLSINDDLNVGIGTTSPDEKLTVKGKIHTQEVRVDMLGSLVPDYVFANDYKLKSLQEVEAYIKQNSHLPEIPSAKEIEKNGLMLAEMNMSLLKKMEEMTLYMIEQQKISQELIKKVEILESALKNNNLKNK